ncbi:DUF6663 family protein [Halobellus rubicundus]|uniref:DUF6663 family protein n=1 Tax=Halobellus rubicundus TaxID=2996466 RepID=A0ABD5M880_9EURY
MHPTTDGRYRVLGRPHDPAELLLLSVEAIDADRVPTEPVADAGGSAEPTDSADSADSADALAPVYLDTERFDYEGDLAATVEALRAGVLVDATIEWVDGDPRFDAVSVVAETAFEFYDDVTGLFEAAKRTWMVAEGDNAPMHGRVTKNTDGDPNGALYVFAKQSGARDLFEEFRTGVTPLDPLVRRADRAESVPPERDQARAVFVLRPVAEPFIVVYVVFRRDGVLAETLRSTYG